MRTDSDQVRQYENLVASRRRGARALLIPTSHRVNWDDAPSKFNIDVEAARVPLCRSLNSKELRVGGTVVPSIHSPNPSVSIEELSDFLVLTTGVLRRKLAVNWTVNSREAVLHRKTTYGRGTASGGGLYPVVVYLLLRGRLGIQPGVYQYDDAHHSLARLRLGSFESSIAMALNFQQADSSDLLIILTVRFWKSLFKYHNFAYQVASQDVGACIGSMEQVAHALGWSTTVVYWFRDRLICSLLGVHVDNEAPFAILTVGKAKSSNKSKDSGIGSAENFPTEFVPNIYHRLYERSKRTFIPKMLSSVHQDTLLEEVTRPVLASSVWPLNIPSTAQKSINTDLSFLLMHRQTNWGQFRREPMLEVETLNRILEFVAYGVQYNSDLYMRRVALPSIRLAVIAQRVSNLQPGAYNYSFGDSRLNQLNNWVPRSPMQPIYSLLNHNLDQVSVLLVVVGRLDAVLTSLGGRGIRVMNAEAGMAAQRAYLAAAAYSLGCGAALGIDAQRISEILDLDSQTEIPLLLIFIGKESDQSFAYDFALV